MKIHPDKLPPFEPRTEREAYIAETLGDKYQFIRHIGEGSTATVYAVVNKALDRIEALKVLLDDLMRDEDFLARFKVEAKICASFAHPNIVTIYDYGKLEKFYSFSMFYVDGPALTEFVVPRNSMSVHRICTNMATISKAIHYAHERGVIHRDIKTSNIMLDQFGKPYVTDFGLAKSERSLTQTRSGVLMGSPVYMSPEQIEGGELDSRSDIYSLGVTLYVLLTNRYPFEGDSAMSILSKRSSQSPTPPETYNPDLPPRLIEIISRTLQPDRRDRYQSAAELAEQLDDFLEGETSAAHTGAIVKYEGQGPEDHKPWLRDKKWRLAVAALIATAIAVPLLFVFVLRDISIQPGMDETQTQIHTPPPDDTEDNGGVDRNGLIASTNKKIATLLVELSTAFEAGRYEDCVRMAEKGLNTINKIPAADQNRFNQAQTALNNIRRKSAAKIKAKEKLLAKVTRTKEEIAELLIKSTAEYEDGRLDACVTTVEKGLGKINAIPSEHLSRFDDARKALKNIKDRATAKINANKERLAMVTRTKEEIAELLIVLSAKFDAGRYSECIRMAGNGLNKINALTSENREQFRKARAALIGFRDKSADKRIRLTKKPKFNKDRKKLEQAAQQQHADKPSHQQQRDNKLSQLLATIEGHYQKGEFKSVLETAGAAQTIIQSIPANEKSRYTLIGDKVKRYRSLADSAIKIKTQQRTILQKIQRSIAKGNFEEAISLIDAVLIRSDLSWDFRQTLNSQRKKIAAAMPAK